MVATYLLHRPHDLIVLGVRWSGPEPVDGDLIAPPGGAVLTVVFPPQHVAEQVETTGSEPLAGTAAPVWRAQLAGASTVAYDVAGGTRIPLTVEGVLAATAAEHRRDGTVIELPWRLHLAPGSGAWRHSTRPVVSPDGASGLWRTRVAEPAAAVEVFAIDDGAAQTDDPFPLALAWADRTILAAEASSAPALARRLELTTLGGTLSASGRWPGFAWDQSTALGRDVTVHTVSEARMFPFGHRAEFVSLTQRVFDAATGTAALRKVVTLEFVDPVVTTPADDATFPFDAVEVLQSTFAPLPEPAWAPYLRGSGVLAQMEEKLNAMLNRIAELKDEVEREMTRDYTLEEYAAFDQTAARVVELRDAIVVLEADLGAANADRARANEIDGKIAGLNAKITDAQTQSPLGPDGPDPSVAEKIAAWEDEITQLRAERPSVQSNQWFNDHEHAVAAATLERDTLYDRIKNALTADRTLDELALSNPNAAEYRDLRVEAAAFAPLVEDERAASTREHPWYVIPSDGDGPLRIPVRLTGPEGPVDITVPMIAVRAFSFDESGPLPAFDSLTDTATLAALTRLWDELGGGAVPTAPTRVDLVRDERRAERRRAHADVAPSSAPGDVRVVHALQIAGSLVDGRYRAALESFTLGLPEIDTLLPAIPPVLYRYSRDFLADPAADLVFETVGDAIDISFVDDARNAGALLSPRIAADGLSRTLGPVAADAVRDAVGDTIDPAQLFAPGATLLGFELADILEQIDRAHVPSIVSDLVDGRPPIVTMTWTDLAVRSVGPFVSRDTRLTLEVVFGPEGATVDCRLTAFELALPLPDVELLRLRFGGLGYTMRVGESPGLEIIGGLSAEFTGELRLLQSLQDAVQIGDGGPIVHAGRDGISARYALAVPPVATAGFQLRDITFRAGVDVPFGPEPPSVAIAFGSRERPFLATVLMFGGGGYFDLVIDHRGIRSLEASIEFGASIGVDFFIVEAEMHVLGAFRYAQTGAAIALTGYLRMGGCVKVLGLVSISVEIVLSLTYQSAGNQLVGRATLVLEIDLTLYSTSVELDTGPWYISGGPAGAAPESLDGGGARRDAVDPDLFVAQWRQYRSAFA